MRRKLKILGMAGLVALAVPMTAFAAAPEATTEFVIDLWNSHGYERRMRDYRNEFARMDVAVRDTLDRISVKEQLVTDLLADRLTFVEVVQRFELLNAGRPTANVFLPQGITRSDEELTARSVLSYVSVRGQPLGYALPRFAAEYEARYGRPYPGKK